MIYQDFDPTSVFCALYTRLRQEKIKNSTKPRKLEIIRDRRADLLEIFAAFLNHLVAVEYPGKGVSPLYADTAEEVLIRLSRLPIPRVTANILGCFEFEENGRFVRITLRDAVPEKTKA